MLAKVCRKLRVACALSGGVDSAVAALLLKKNGHDVVGIFMRNWDGVEERGSCADEQDREDAHWVARQLGIELRETSFVKEYWHHVFAQLLDDYRRGLTPNPDVLCNRHVKFSALLDHALQTCGAQALATGHYARIVHDPEDGGVRLLKAADSLKDQTFFLSQVSNAALQKAVFPVGSLLKSEVKAAARANGLQRIAAKKESMGLCFVGSRDFKTFISQYIEKRPGSFVDVESGRVVGTHEGIHLWTPGQRCHLAGKPCPYYVCKIEPATGNILVAPGKDHPALYCHDLITDEPHWISMQPPVPLDGRPARLDFRYHHTDDLVQCDVSYASPAGTGSLRVKFANGRVLRAVAPGQFAVFYRGDECLGSARIAALGVSLWDADAKNAAADRAAAARAQR